MFNPNQFPSTTTIESNNAWGELADLPKQHVGFDETEAHLKPEAKDAPKNTPETAEQKHFSIGRKVLAPFLKAREKLDSTFNGGRRMTEYYLKDRSKKNLEFLQQYEPLYEDSMSLKTVYTDIISEYPELSNIELEQLADPFENNACATYAAVQPDKRGLCRPVITYNFQSTAYTVDTNMSKKTLGWLTEGNDQSSKIFNEQHATADDMNFAIKFSDAYRVADYKFVAQRLGITTDQICNNHRLLQTVVFAHEFGHQLDFRRNSFNGNFSEPGQVNSAVEFSSVMRRVFTERSSNPEEISINSQLKARKDALGKNSPSFGGIIEDERLYRSKPSEEIADIFAAEFVKKYAPKYGFAELLEKPQAS